MAKGDWYLEILSGDCFEIREEHDDDTVRVVALCYPDDWHQGIKDGYLLAAAPKLLAACQIVLKYHEESTDQRLYSKEQQESLPPTVDFGDCLDAAIDAVKVSSPPESENQQELF